MTAMGTIFAQYVYKGKQLIENVPAVYLDEVNELIALWEAEAAATTDTTTEGGA